VKPEGEDIPEFQDEEESYSDYDNQISVPADKKQFPFQSGERLLPFQSGGRRGTPGNSIEIRKLCLEDRLKLGVSAQVLTDIGLTGCDGYTSFKGYLAYKNSRGDVFLFEMKKDKDNNDEYVLWLYVDNSRRL
jgi:hypothetical protein